MAKDKNGFVLYKDLLPTIKKLVERDRANKTNYAGELFLHILEYVNDENPVAIDFIIEMAFEPIKQTLKRDLKKYEMKLESKSISGRVGNLKRWNEDLFYQYESKFISLEEAEEIAESRKYRKCDKSVAKIADRDTDTVRGIDSDILLKKETKKENLSKENPTENFPKSEPVEPGEEERKKVAPKKERFKPPTVQEVQDYCNERQNGIQAYTFVNFYQSKGWKVGNQPMKDWRAAVRTWEQKNKQNGITNTTNTGFSNNSTVSNGKVSGRSIVADRISQHLARNSESGNHTIDIEANIVR